MSDCGTIVLRPGDHSIWRGMSVAKLWPQGYWLAVAVLVAPRFSVDDAIELLYADRGDGGPITARNAVAKLMTVARRVIAPLGINVITHGKQGYSVRIDEIPADRCVVATIDAATHQARIMGA